MPRSRSHLVVLSLLTLAALTADTRAGGSKGKRVDFNRDIRPILSNNCFACHGPDRNLRKAKFRLDTEEGAFADRGGYHAVVPGKPQDSELYRRITAKNARERMPPAQSHKQLAARDIDLIRSWIEQARSIRATGRCCPSRGRLCPPSRIKAGRATQSITSSSPDWSKWG